MGTTFCVTGATGFIGKHLVERLLRDGAADLRLLTRGTAPAGQERARWICGDMAQNDSLEGFVQPGSVVVNLAFSSVAAMDAQITSAQTLAQWCARAGAKRLVHVSTAMVIGQASQAVIDELTPPRPLSAYERTKLAVEQALLESLVGTCEVVVLRPTAVFGAGGANLVKMANVVAKGSAVAAYLKSCFHGGRSMHLVDIDAVVEAIWLLATTPAPVDRETYIVAMDNAPSNNYRDVEVCMRRAFGKAVSRVPRVRVPLAVLRFVLRRARHVGLAPDARFSSAKLEALGFRPPVSFETALVHYTEYLADQYSREGAITG